MFTREGMWARLKALICLMLLLLAGLPARAEGYDIATGSVLAEVAADGGAHVSETYIYKLDGATELKIVLPEDALSAAVKLDGEARALTDGAAVLTPAEGAASAVVECEYDVANFARRYRDAGYVSRAFFAGEAVSNATVVLRLPGSEGEIDALAGGAYLDEDVALSGSIVALGPRSIASGEEGRVEALFPESWLSGAATIDEDIRGEALLDVNRAASERERVLRSKALILCGYALVFAAIITPMALKWRFNWRKIAPRAGAEREYPAPLSALCAKGATDTYSLVGWLMELADKRRVKIESGGARVLIADAPDGWEGETLEALARGKREFDAGRLRDAAFKGFIAKVAGEAKRRGLARGNEGAQIAVAACALLSGIPLTAVDIIWLEASYPIAIIQLALTAIALTLCSRLDNLTDEGRALAAAAAKSDYAPLRAALGDVPPSAKPLSDALIMAARAKK